MKSHKRPNSVIRLLAPALAVLFEPSLAQAHVVLGQTSGFIHGLVHPLTGLDHIVTMMAIGLWAAQRGGRALWTVPLTFVSVMAVGGLLGMMDVSIPFVEQGIIASVLILGVLIVSVVRLPLVASSLLVGLFAVFHGLSHGAEMPETVSGLAYGIGFIMATGMLHGIGVGLGLLVQKLDRPRLIRYAGSGIAAFGIYLLIA
jgi:urease accessory protein